MKWFLFANGFFCMFLAVHASIAGDSASFILMMIMGIGSVCAAMGLTQWTRSIHTMRREQALTERARGSYERLDGGHDDADAVIDPEILYPLWQKCNRCGVYLANHGTADHPWEEWAGGSDGHHTKGIGWDLGPGRVIELTEPDEGVQLWAWGEEKPVTERQWTREQTRQYRRQVERNRQKKKVLFENNTHYNTVLGCTCRECDKRRHGGSCLDHGVWQTCHRCKPRR